MKMKRLITILLLTLLTGVAFSQQGVGYQNPDSFDTNIFIGSEGIDSTYWKRTDVILSDYVNHTTPILTLRVLLKYVEHCYDDSTAVAYKIFNPWENIIYDRKDYIRVRKDLYEPFYHYGEHIKDTIIYEHTQPTFTGFIEWLKERK